MKIILAIIAVLIIAACTTPQEDLEKARQYKLELNYLQNAVQLLNKSMVDKAITSCNQTTLLRSECFTILAQDMLARGLFPKKEVCEEIKPNYRIPMTIRAFTYVYGPLDEDMRAEVNQKRWPSKDRKNQIQIIKDNCENG